MNRIGGRVKFPLFISAPDEKKISKGADAKICVSYPDPLPSCLLCHRADFLDGAENSAPYENISAP